MTGWKSFGSDNHAGAHEAVMRAVAAANAGDAHAYGADQWTEGVADELRGLFGARGGVYFVFNGSAANVLGLSLLLRPYEAAICAESAHINTDECGAAERLLGCKLLLVQAPDGKLTPDLVQTRLAGIGDEHHVQPRAVCITQSTELGTCYTLQEMRELGDFCRSRRLRLYADGARLANAAAYLGCSLADLAAPVDALSFGGTKNGAVGAEALVVMSDDLVAEVPFQRKQLLHLASKMRFLAAQFGALLEGDLWLRNARHANAMARRLADGLQDIPGASLRYPVQANGVFARLDRRYIKPLQDRWGFYVWDDGESVVRLMTAFDTTERDVDALLADVREVALSRV